MSSTPWHPIENSALELTHYYLTWPECGRYHALIHIGIGGVSYQCETLSRLEPSIPRITSERPNHAPTELHYYYYFLLFYEHYDINNPIVLPKKYCMIPILRSTSHAGFYTNTWLISTYPLKTLQMEFVWMRN